MPSIGNCQRIDNSIYIISYFSKSSFLHFDPLFQKSSYVGQKLLQLSVPWSTGCDNKSFILHSPSNTNQTKRETTIGIMLDIYYKGFVEHVNRRHLMYVPFAKSSKKERKKRSLGFVIQKIDFVTALIYTVIVCNRELVAP